MMSFTDMLQTHILYGLLCFAALQQTPQTLSNRHSKQRGRSLLDCCGPPFLVAERTLLFARGGTVATT